MVNKPKDAFASDAAPSLLEYLTSHPEQQRVLAVAEFAEHVETYARTVSMMLGGLALKAGSKDIINDLFAAQFSVNEIVNWAALHKQVLTAHANPQAANNLH